MLRQRTLIVYECSASTDICSDKPLNNRRRGKIWDLIIDNILAEKETNFSLLSPICLLLPYDQAAKIIAAFSEPHFNIQRSFISHYFSCNSYKQGTTYIFPLLLRSVKFAAYLLIYFKYTVVFTHTKSTPLNVLCCSIHLISEVCLEVHTLQSLVICCSTQ